MKRVTALLLLILLVMAPFSASLATSPASVLINGVTLNSSTPYYVNGATAAQSTAPASWNAYYDAANGVLKIRNLNVTGSSADPQEGDICGIYAGGNTSNDLTIEMEGNNSVSTDDSRTKNLCAVKIDCNLTIQGSGKLTVTAGKAAAASGSGTSTYGLWARSITQNSGTVTAYGGEAPFYSSYGVYAMNAIAVTGGSLTGVGGKSGVNRNVESVGVISTSSGITVSGGSLTGIGGWAKDSARSRGVYAVGSQSISSGRLVGKAAAGGTALNKQPSPLPTAYYWRTSDSAGYTQSSRQAYLWDAAHTYVDIRTSLPSAGVIGEAGDVGPDVPKTGDSATPMLWLGILLLAGAGFTVSRRKRQNG